MHPACLAVLVAWLLYMDTCHSFAVASMILKNKFVAQGAETVCTNKNKLYFEVWTASWINYCIQFCILEQLLHHSAHNMDFCFLIPGICVALALCIAVPRGSKNRFFNYAFLRYTVSLTTVIIIIINWFQSTQVSFFFGAIHTGELCYLSCTIYMLSWK